MNGQADTAAEFGRKLKSLVSSHRRFITDFENSLKNSGRFLALADRALEQEPESTVDLLQQIREIDLLGHLQRLSEEFDGLRGALATSPFWGESAAHQAELERLSERYEALQAEAVNQLSRIETLLQALEV
jgi:hypothetical protein